MRNASKMARYMMMRTGREGADRGGNYGARNTYPDMRMGDYGRETEVRNVHDLACHEMTWAEWAAVITALKIGAEALAETTARKAVEAERAK